MKSFNLLKAIAGQTGGQVFGLVLALAVSVGLATQVGVGIDSDTFFLARRVVTSLTEALNKVLVIVYIPLFMRLILAGSGLDQLRRSLLSLAGVSIVIAVIAWFAAPLIISLLAPDQQGAQLSVTISVLRVFILALPAAMLAVGLSSYCNASGSFAIPAFSKQLPRITLLAGLLCFTLPIDIEYLAWAFTAGSYLIVTSLLFVVMQDLKVSPNQYELSAPGEDNNTARVLAMFLVLIGSQCQVWLESYFAISTGQGGLSLLEYSQRLANLLPGVISFSLVGVIYTGWCRMLESGNRDELEQAFYYWLVLGLVILLPISAFIYLNAESLVSLILGHGRFSAQFVGQSASLIKVMVPSVLGAFYFNTLIARVLADKQLPMLTLIAIFVVLDLLLRLLAFSYLSGQQQIQGVALVIGWMPVLMALICWGVLSASRMIAPGVVNTRLLASLLLIPFVTVVCLFVTSELLNHFRYSSLEDSLTILLAHVLTGTLSALLCVWLVRPVLNQLRMLIQVS